MSRTPAAANPAATDTGRAEPDITIGVYVHQAVVVQWQKSDRSNFPFSVPDMAWPTMVYSWVPGTPLTDLNNGTGGGGGGKESSGVSTGTIALIAVCSIVGFIVFVGILCCVGRRLEGRPARTLPARRGIELTESKTGQGSN